MTKAVSALPMAERMAFLDVKDGIAQNLLSSYNGMTNGQAGLMQGILGKVLDLDSLKNQFVDSNHKIVSVDTQAYVPLHCTGVIPLLLDYF